MFCCAKRSTLFSVLVFAVENQFSLLNAERVRMTFYVKINVKMRNLITQRISHISIYLLFPRSYRDHIQYNRFIRLYVLVQGLSCWEQIYPVQSARHVHACHEDFQKMPINNEKSLNELLETDIIWKFYRWTIPT